MGMIEARGNVGACRGCRQHLGTSRVLFLGSGFPDDILPASYGSWYVVQHVRNGHIRGARCAVALPSPSMTDGVASTWGRVYVIKRVPGESCPLINNDPPSVAASDESCAPTSILSCNDYQCRRIILEVCSPIWRELHHPSFSGCYHSCTHSSAQLLNVAWHVEVPSQMADITCSRRN